MFREKVKSDAAMRLIDVMGHMLWMLLFPGKWWYQLIPDMWLPFVFTLSWQSNKLLPDNNIWLWYHKLFHSVWGMLAIVFTFYVFSDNTYWVFGLLCQLFSHIIWDQFTHLEGWNKKSLWKI